MGDESLKKIEILKEFSLSELDERIRKIRLKGFPEIEIYKDSNISIQEFSPEKIVSDIFTPQPRVYRTFIDRINNMAKLFLEQGIDIFKLQGGVDYLAIDDEGIKTEWTLIPPVVEVILIKFSEEGLDYEDVIGEELKKRMLAEGHTLNEELKKMWFEEFNKHLGLSNIKLICDGSNRIHAAVEKGINQNLLVIDAPKKGFPYYAAPKPYSKVHVEAERIDGSKSDKTHILSEPGHKHLYRLFPSGGILSGDVRKD